MNQQLLYTDLADGTSSLSDRDRKRVEEVVAIKACVRLFEAWKLDNPIAESMISVDARTWTQMKDGTWNGLLNQDQLMRLSAIIGLYKALHLYFGDNIADSWVTLPNEGPLFSGRKPVEVMVDGGLPMIMKTRNYVDALRGGV